MVPRMPQPTRTFAAVLGALIAVFAVVLGTAAATGSVPGATNHSAVPDRQLTPVSQGDDSSTRVQDAAPVGMAAIPAPPDAARDATVAATPGRLLATGQSLTIEEVPLADGTTILRLTATAGPYQMRDMPAVLSVDGQALGRAAESTDLSSLVLYTTDEAVLTDGATIALTYGLPGQAPAVWSTTVTVVK
jgi:hypothetical protein